MPLPTKIKFVFFALQVIFCLTVTYPRNAFSEAGLIWGDTVVGKIEAAFRDGSNRQVLHTNTPAVEAIVIDSVHQKLFWSENPGMSRRIRSSNLDGTNAITVAHALSGNDFIFGLTLDPTSQKVYWTEYNSGVVRSANYDGSDSSTLIPGLHGPVGLDIDAADGKLYFSEGEENRILSADIDGANVVVVYDGLPTAPLQLVLDTSCSPKQIYYGLFNSLNRVDVDGGSPEEISNGIGIFTALAIDFQTREAFIGDVGSHTTLRVGLDGVGLTTVLTSTWSIFGVTLGDVLAVPPTPTVTPTPTPTQTPLPTETRQPTATPVSTFSPAVTAAPEPSATSSPTATQQPVPSLSPSATPTPAPPTNIGAGSIAGTLTDSLGRPIANALISLYESDTSQRGVERTMLVTDRVIKTTLTNVFGNYTFTGIPEGTFRLEPKLDGVAFSPPSIAVDSGTKALPIAGQQTSPPELQSQCNSRNIVAKLVNFGAATEKLLASVRLGIDRQSRSLSKQRTSEQVAQMLVRLAKLENNVTSLYSSALATSSSFPLVVLTCPKNLGCQTMRFGKSLDQVRSKLKKMLTSAEKSSALVYKKATASASSRTGDLGRTFKRYATAVRLSGELPVRSDKCG